MARTHKKAGEEAVNRLTGAAAHQHERETGPHGDAGDGQGLDQAETEILDSLADLRDLPTVAMGRAAVPPPVSPAVSPPVSPPVPPPVPPTVTRPLSPSVTPPLPPPAGRPLAPPVAGPIELPPIESYEELLDGLGERPFDSPRPVTPEAAWGRSLRHFARASVWTLPVAATCFALSGMWGWPTRNAEPSGESPGTWLVVTVFGLILGLAGVLAITALLSATPGRRWSLAALLMVLTGTVLLAPVLGVIALARPAVSRVADRLGPDAAADLEGRFFDNAISRWLGIGGLTLLAVGWLAFGCAVLASGVLNRVDGYLVLCAVGIATIAAYMSWQFLITVAAMVLLAAGLGLSWTASRLTPDGRTPVDA